MVVVPMLQRRIQQEHSEIVAAVVVAVVSAVVAAVEADRRSEEETHDRAAAVARETWRGTEVQNHNKRK